MIIFLFGMKILELSTSMLTSKILYDKSCLGDSLFQAFKVLLSLPSYSRYIQLVKKHGLEISQPGLEPNNGLTWQMTKRRGDREVHKYVLHFMSSPLLTQFVTSSVYTLKPST